MICWCLICSRTKLWATCTLTNAKESTIIQSVSSLDWSQQNFVDIPLRFWKCRGGTQGRSRWGRVDWRRTVARAEHHSSTHGDESRCKSERRKYFLVCKNLHTVGLRPENTWSQVFPGELVGESYIIKRFHNSKIKQSTRLADEDAADKAAYEVNNMKTSIQWC